MNDEETVALIAGGHTFGKTHGAADAGEHRRSRARGRPARGAGPGLGQQATATARAATRSPAASKAPGPRRRRSGQPTSSTTSSRFEWELTKSPAGAHQWRPKDGGGAARSRTPHGPAERPPTMLTTDLALRFDPTTRRSRAASYENPDAFADAFARAWFKLTHRDMGPIERYLGPEVPEEELIWQDPIPEVNHDLVDARTIATLKAADPRLRPDRLRAGPHRLGLGLDLPRQRQARRRQRRAPAPGAAEGLGGQRPGRARQGAQPLEGIQEVTRQGGEGLAGRPDRARRCGGGREGGQARRGVKVEVPVHPGPR